MTIPLLEVKELSKGFVVGGGALKAVDDVSFTVEPGETLSIVGESGCGKSTLAKLILRLTPITSGEILFGGLSYGRAAPAAMKALRRRLQVVFQDPFSSMNPRMRVGDIVAEPLINFGVVIGPAALRERVQDLLHQVGLPPEAARRYPHEFSGGQRQRICIARALAPGPELIVCDEAVSALDVSVKAQIINLLSDHQEQSGVAFLFISHDLAVVEHVTHRVAVMYLGRIAEIATRHELFGGAHHPYTRALLSAVPTPEFDSALDRIRLRGDVPNPMDPPPGCAFNSRCPFAFDRCKIERPQLRPLSATHASACHLDDVDIPCSGN
jgi:peptide/nickel transport system ATP-binding protein